MPVSDSALRQLKLSEVDLFHCVFRKVSHPAGTVLAGSKEDPPARYALVGGMRQIGILAAAGIYALDHMSNASPRIMPMRSSCRNACGTAAGHGRSR